MQSHRFPLLTIAIATLIAATAQPTPATACPLCSSVQYTLSERFQNADTAILAKWIATQKKTAQKPGSTTYEIVNITKGSKATLQIGKQIQLADFQPAKKGNLFLLFGEKQTNKKQTHIKWNTSIFITKTGFQYFSKTPKTTTKRLQYFVNHLESPDQLIAYDAFNELAKAPRKSLIAISKFMPRKKLRQWVTNPKTAPTRLGLYGIMLGLCGNQDDAQLMKKIILAVDTKNPFRLGMDGVITGYLLLTKEKGLTLIENTKLKKQPTSPEGSDYEAFAAIQAVRFVWEFAPQIITKTRLRNAMRLVLDRPELADIVISDLAHWKDWGIQNRLMKMYDTKEFNFPSIRRSIIRFMLTCADDFKKGTPAGKLPQHVITAKKHLITLEKKDPQTFKEAKKIHLYSE